MGHYDDKLEKFCRYYSDKLAKQGLLFDWQRSLKSVGISFRISYDGSSYMWGHYCSGTTPLHEIEPALDEIAMVALAEKTNLGSFRRYQIKMAMSRGPK